MKRSPSNCFKVVLFLLLFQYFFSFVWRVERRWRETWRKCPYVEILKMGYRKMLYNIWHGFLVRSKWAHVLWQAVTLWLVNRGTQCARKVRLNRFVTGRKPRDNHVVRFRQRQRIGSRARDMQPIRGLGRLWRYSLHVVASVGTSWLF